MGRSWPRFPDTRGTYTAGTDPLQTWYSAQSIPLLVPYWTSYQWYRKPSMETHSTCSGNRSVHSHHDPENQNAGQVASLWWSHRPYGRAHKRKVFKGLKRSMTGKPLKDWIEAAGIKKHITFHCFRQPTVRYSSQPTAIRTPCSNRCATNTSAPPCVTPTKSRPRSSTPSAKSPSSRNRHNQ